MANKVDRKQLGKRNLEWGAFCEQLAADYYLKEGYVIRERNWRMNKIEIDLIVEKDRTIVFVEVKGREGVNSDPILAVDVKKQKKMVNAADIYLRQLKHLYQYRFDIFGVEGDFDNYVPKCYPDAFMPMVNSGR